jgi:hypothetical protein
VKRPLSLAAMATCLVLLASCSTRYIGNTKVEDTSENREILQVVEQYRRAVEDRDVQRVLDLTSDRYMEDPGTPGDPSDDYDKAGLRKRLETSFSKVEEQRLRIDARKITRFEGEKLPTVGVEYRFDFRYKMALPGNGEWREAMDLNRVVLVQEEDGWKILSGL